jgi:hypothetical protein
MVNPKCEICGKTAYPLESVTAIEKTFHKTCFKCSVCSCTLNLKNFKGFEGKIYCHTHTPKVKSSVITTDSIVMKNATSAPKKDLHPGVHKADPRVAPASRGDFSFNQVADQSTENTPESSGITYETHNPDQTTENNPQSSGISYEAYNPDQSTENAPESSGISYEAYNPDQSTETYDNAQEEQVQYE